MAYDLSTRNRIHSGFICGRVFRKLRDRNGKQAKTAERELLQLRLKRIGGMVARQRYEVRALCAGSPRAQGKIERWHQTLRIRILLENSFLPGDLEAQIEAFVDHDNHQHGQRS